LEQNILQNSILKELVHLDPSAISDQDTEIYFDVNASPEILSSILFSDEKTPKTKVNVKNLAKEISLFHQNLSRKLIIKMDIEGAEWKTLSNSEVLEELHLHKALMLLAVHPGFARPMPKFAQQFLVLRTPWLIRQILDSIELYSRIDKFSKINRTNLNPVSNKYKFALLVIAGYHEFIIDFN
jgi:FkbM family methyltransferase